MFFFFFFKEKKDRRGTIGVDMIIVSLNYLLKINDRKGLNRETACTPLSRFSHNLVNHILPS
jgi:hypothetical protein